jgi:hypothetical protein
MTEDLLIILLSATSLGTLIWILWEKKQGRNWFGRWLVALGILMIPLILVKWLAPAAWMAPFTMPFFIKVFAALPFSFGLASFGGGLLLLFGLIINAIIEGLGDVDWSRTRSESTDYAGALGGLMFSMCCVASDDDDD